MGIVSNRLKLFVTASPKVASTSLKQAFFMLENGFPFRNYSTNGGVHDIHSAVYPTRSINEYDKKKFTEFRKFAIVRDPVERLVSFFNDKIIDNDCLSLCQSDGLRKNNLTSKPDFDFFVENLTDYRQSVLEVKHHTDPLIEFIGDAGWYDAVFSVDQMESLQTTISKLTAADFSVPCHNQSKRVLLSSALSGKTMDKIRDFYAEDYVAYGRYLEQGSVKGKRSTSATTDDNQTSPSSTATKSDRKAFSAVTVRKTFHVLGIPHTVTTKDYSVCAFTQKVLNLCRMLTDLGHEVIHYGHEDSEVTCTEHVSVVSRSDHLVTYGDHDWKKSGFPKFSTDDHVYRTFQENTVKAVRARRRGHDFLLCTYGGGHKGVADNLEKMIVVEPGIGYPSGHFAPFKVFESYAILHAYNGLDAVKSAKNDFWYNVVIPNYYDLRDFVYSKEKQDYMLFLGRIGEGKGVHIAIQLANACKKKLVIAGPDMYNTLRKFEGVESEYVTYVGQVGPKDRAELLSQAQCVLTPSTFLEPFCGVHVEAMLSGTPVVSSDWGAFSEYNLHGYTGYRCQTFEQFCWAIKNIDRIDPLYCSEWARKNFSLERVAGMYDEYFNSVHNVFAGGGWYEPNQNRIDLDMRKLLLPHRQQI